MRKRRRLANKMTIMVCAVLIAVSAFFYAPMEVSAEELSNSLTVNVDDLEVASQESIQQINDSYNANISMYGPYYLTEIFLDTNNFNLVDNVDDSKLYEIGLNFDLTMHGNSSDNTNFYGITAFYGDNLLFFKDASSLGPGAIHNLSDSMSFYAKGSDLKNGHIYLHCVVMGTRSDSRVVDISYSIDITSLNEVSASGSEDYQNGYNAGYSAGESAGYGNGYSQGFSDGEASVDTDAIYDEAFQAGKDSVDTQSYYDAGYQAGYQVAYSEGYESGYDVGYQDAMDRIEGWGADTNDYPLLVFNYLYSESGSFVGGSFGGSSAGVDSPIDLLVSESFETDFVINSNHTYKISVFIDNLQFGYSDTRIVCSSNTSFFTVGSSSYLIHSSYPYVAANITSTFYLPGSFMSSVLSFDFIYNSAVVYGLTMPEISYDSFGFYIYDMGSSGDTQNHIANQTDQLTHGYDDSKGNTVNSELSTGLNEFETAENSLFATATTGMKDFTFFDFESVPAMLTAVTFITSIMGSWFEQAGGASGVGIVLSILFSVMLVSMVLGLYRLYQSAGHRAEARERHRERMEQWKRRK